MIFNLNFGFLVYSLKDMTESCLVKQQKIKELFVNCPTPADIFHCIMDLGKELPKMPSEYQIEENIVPGCQSIVYLHSTFTNKKIYFTAHSEALISAGLAALLIQAYSEEPPEALLKCPPIFIKELGIAQSLSPGRSNGLASMFLRMQKEAIKYLKPFL